LLVPIKDEISSLGRLTTEVTAAMDSRPPDGRFGNRWELVFIDDGSTDGSWSEIVNLHAKDDRIRGLRLRRNFGKSAALSAGFAGSAGATRSASACRQRCSTSSPAPSRD
jgi:glycosyltransferase involved in cell wall biosynthesis